MSLEDTIKELKEQIAEEEKKEIEAEAEAEAPEEEKEEEIEEEAAPEEEKEEAKEEEKKEEEEKPDSLAYQRMRREAAAAKKKADALEAEVARLKSREEKVDEQEESQPEINPELEEIVRTHRLSRAEREFQELEGKFKAKTPEYDDVATEYTMGMAHSIRMQNPRLSNLQIAEKTKEIILMKAANFMQGGFDPIEELYHEAKELGYTGASVKKKEVAEGKEEEIKPDMKKLAANRAKSTGMAASNGRAAGQMTQAAAADLSVAEWSKLPAEEKRRLMYQQ